MSDTNFLNKRGFDTTLKWIKDALKKKSDTGHTHDDRYYTETEVNTKLSSKSDTTHSHQWKDITSKPSSFTPSSHTHTKSEISDFPTSLPANGGNSSTVNGHSVNADVPSGAKFTDTNTWNAFKGATSAAAGSAGYLPAPAAGDQSKLFRADGTWVVPNWTDLAGKPSSFTPSSHTHDDRYYTESEIDTKLNGKANSNHTHSNYLTGITSKLVTDALGYTPPKTDTNTWRGIQNNLTSDSTSDSLSAAQGKALKALVDGKADSSHSHAWSAITGKPSTFTPSSHTHKKSDISDFPTSLPASDVYSWAKASTKPSYAWSEITGKPSTFSPSSHTHDDRYYTESEIDTKLSAKLDMRTAYGIASCAGSGKYSYCKIATIKISASYINSPIVFELSGRGRHLSELTLIFANVESTDPALGEFKTNYDNCYYIKKTTTSTWEVYGQYSETWGNLCIHRLTGTGSNIGVTVNMTNLDALPSGCTQASYGGNVGYASVAASANAVAWGNVSGKPSTYAPSSHTHTKSQISDFPSSLPASDVYSWAKSSTKPSYSWSEITSKPSSFTPASHTHNYAGSSSAGGVANESYKLTNAFSGRQTSGDIDFTNSAYANKVTYTVATSSMTTGKPPTDATLLSFGWDTVAGWGSQIAIGAGSGNHMYVRGADSKNNKCVYGSWSTILDSANYTDYAAAKSHSHSYNDLTNKPTIPSVGNGTVTITQNGTTKGSFTMNQSGNATIALSDTNTTYGAATTSANGLMTSTMVTKLNGIATGATAVTDSTVSGWGYKKTDNNTWIAFKGATTSAAGTAGYAPAPSAGAANRYLRSDGTWSVPPDTNTNTWRGIQNNLTSDSTTDSLSAAQGKALKALVDGKAASSHTHSNYVTNNAASTVNAPITFGKNDSYGILTSTDNYCSIGSSSAYFYRGFINQMNIKNLLFKEVNTSLDANTRKSIFGSGIKESLTSGFTTNSLGNVSLGDKITDLNSTNGGSHHVICCFMANSSSTLCAYVTPYRAEGCTWGAHLTNVANNTSATGWTNIMLLVLYTNW